MTDEIEPPADSDATAKTTDPDPTAKTADDGTPVAGPAPPERWEEVGRRALGLLVDERKGDLDRAVGELVATLDYGTPVDETHLENLRDAIAGLECVVEYDVADLVAGATAFEQTAERVPFGCMATALDVELATLDRIAAAGEAGEAGDDGESALADRPAGGSGE